MTFPGAGARIFYNEVGEPLGWDYPDDDAPPEPDEDDYDQDLIGSTTRRMMRTPEQLRELSDEIQIESDDLREYASSLEQWHAVQLLRQVSASLFSVAGDLDIHTEKYGVSKDA